MTEIEEFIDRRFPIDCNWTTGNCFFFAKILEAAFPGGNILYDIINGHCVSSYCGYLYDWNGIYNEKDAKYIDWEKFEEYDSAQYNRIIRDCRK